MKKITAYKCDFCTKILQTHSGISKHEKKCFKNPKSKSCITCKHLSLTSTINGKELNQGQKELLDYKIEGTYNTLYDEDGEEYNVLKDEFQYLYESDMEDYCMATNKILSKLTTNCSRWKLNTLF